PARPRADRARDGRNPVLSGPADPARTGWRSRGPGGPGCGRGRVPGVLGGAGVVVRRGQPRTDPEGRRQGGRRGGQGEAAAAGGGQARTPGGAAGGTAGGARVRRRGRATARSRAGPGRGAPAARGARAVPRAPPASSSGAGTRIEVCVSRLESAGLAPGTSG